MKSTTGPPPERLVRGECARALASGLLFPPRALWYALRRPSYVRELQTHLATPAQVDADHAISRETVAMLAGLKRPLRVFVSAAEPSGEVHAVRLVEALRAELAEHDLSSPKFFGLGSPALAERGVEILGDPVAKAAMGSDVLRSLSFYTKLVEDAARALRERDIDLFLPVDSPALHAPLGRIARRYRVPSVHYVTPQLWGWAPWRTASYRKAVDRALTILPFEPGWFAARNVATTHVGHPQLDALAESGRPLTAARGKTLALLPGSRESVVRRNLPWMLSAAARMRLTHPELPVAVSVANERVAAAAETVLQASGADWARVQHGDLHELLDDTRIALSVSGTVLIDLLVRDVPAVVLYRLKSRWQQALATRALTVPWFASVNLLANREVYPEFAFHGTGPLEEVSERLVSCYKDGPARDTMLAGLAHARQALGPPGAARRAACAALQTWSGTRPAPAMPLPDRTRPHRTRPRTQ